MNLSNISIVSKILYLTDSEGIGLSRNSIRYIQDEFDSSPLDKMAAISADDSFNCIFLNGNYIIPIQLSVKYVPRSLIDNTPALAQVMAWRWTSNKLSAGPVITQLFDAYMRHLGGWVKQDPPTLMQPKYELKDYNCTPRSPPETKWYRNTSVWYEWLNIL